MKKLFLIAFAAVTFVACNNTAKTDESSMTDSVSMDNTTMAAAPMENGDVMMKDGKMMMMKDGSMMEMDKDMTMSNGTMMMMNGDMKMKDGKMMKMKDGEMMKMNGDMMDKDGKMMMDEPMMKDSTKM